MMIEYKGCEESVTFPKIVLKEKRSTITFLNKQRLSIRVIKIDDCVIKEGKRCDYLLVSPNSKHYFIELKGSDVRQAIKQIGFSIEKIIGVNTSGELLSIVILSNSPSFPQTDIQALMNNFSKKYKSKIFIKRSPAVEKIN